MASIDNRSCIRATIKNRDGHPPKAVILWTIETYRSIYAGCSLEREKL